MNLSLFDLYVRDNFFLAWFAYFQYLVWLKDMLSLDS